MRRPNTCRGQLCGSALARLAYQDTRRTITSLSDFVQVVRTKDAAQFRPAARPHLRRLSLPLLSRLEYPCRIDLTPFAVVGELDSFIGLGLNRFDVHQIETPRASHLRNTRRSRCKLILLHTASPLPYRRERYSVSQSTDAWRRAYSR